jgi:type IV fimbrial biogenesis protein FimT
MPLVRGGGGGEAAGPIVRAMQSSPHVLRISRSQRGFTLFELMMTLAIAAVLVGVAVPNMRAFSQNNRLTDAANDLLRGLQVARSEAITRQRTVVLCASSNPQADDATCSFEDFTGWIVFEDTNDTWQRDGTDEIIDQHPTLDPSLTVRTDNEGIVSFAATGFANVAAARSPTDNVVFCDQRGTEAEGDALDAPSRGARALLITPTGRGRGTRVASEVEDALQIGEECP